MVERILLSAVVVAAGCLGVAAADPGRGGAADAATPAAGTTPGPSNETTTNRTTNGTANATVRGVVVREENGTVLLRALVRLDCTNLAVNATPEYRTYALRLVYVHEGTGERATILAGPLNGTVTDPFGRTPYDLQYVDLRFHGVTVLSHEAPERCIGPVTYESVATGPVTFESVATGSGVPASSAAG